jgi:hypothetical protein
MLCLSKSRALKKLVLAAAKARGKRSTRATHGLGSLETVYVGPEYCVASLSRLGGENMGMNTQATKLQAAEDDLKQLMADVTRAMERAQEAVARITSNEAATADTKSEDKKIL